MPFFGTQFLVLFTSNHIVRFHSWAQLNENLAGEKRKTLIANR